MKVKFSKVYRQELDIDGLRTCLLSSIVSGSVYCTVVVLYSTVCTMPQQRRQHWPELTAHHCQALESQQQEADTQKQTPILLF